MAFWLVQPFKIPLRKRGLFVLIFLGEQKTLNWDADGGSQGLCFGENELENWEKIQY